MKRTLDQMMRDLAMARYAGVSIPGEIASDSPVLSWDHPNCLYTMEDDMTPKNKPVMTHCNGIELKAGQIWNTEVGIQGTLTGDIDENGNWQTQATLPIRFNSSKPGFYTYVGMAEGWPINPYTYLPMDALPDPDQEKRLKCAMKPREYVVEYNISSYALEAKKAEQCKQLRRQVSGRYREWPVCLITKEPLRINFHGSDYGTYGYTITTSLTCDCKEGKT